MASPVSVQELVLVILISIDRSYDVGVHAVLMCMGGQCLIAVVCRCARSLGVYGTMFMCSSR